MKKAFLFLAVMVLFAACNHVVSDVSTVNVDSTVLTIDTVSVDTAVVDSTTK